MTTTKTAKCKFTGCRNSAVRGRLFCAERLADYGVAKVAASRRAATVTELIKGKRFKAPQNGRSFVGKKGRGDYLWQRVNIKDVIETLWMAGCFAPNT